MRGAGPAVGAAEDRAAEVAEEPTTVGGSALPGGVMMRTRSRIGVAVRSEETGEVLTESFALPEPRGPWARWPLARGVYAVRNGVVTAKESLAISERLRWADETDEDEAAIGPGGKLMILLGALLGAGIQVAAFRVGPVVIAKEAGLTGAAFIVADAMLRLFLLLGLLWVMSRFAPFRKVLSYHGAEHKAIAAHEGGAPLTASAAAAFTRFHPRCGTSFLVVSALVSIAVYGAVLAITGWFSYLALIATRILGAPVVTAFAFEIQRHAAKHPESIGRFLTAPGLWAQRLTTAEPEHDDLEVAVAALEAALQPEPVAATEPVPGRTAPVAGRLDEALGSG